MKRALIIVFCLLPCSALAQYGASAPSVYLYGVSGPAVDAGSLYTFSAVQQGFVDPQYAVTDQNPTSGGTKGSIDKIGNFTWKPIIYDAGFHTLTLTVTDALGHSASTTVSILVRNNDLLITSLSPGAQVVVGATTTLKIIAPGFANPSYTVYDGSPRTSVNPSRMDSTGAFTWTPISDDVGVHTLVFAASDTSGHSGRIAQIITVTPIVVPITTAAPATSTPSPVPQMPTSPVPAVSSSSPTAPVVAFQFTKTLSIGSRNRDVTELQKKLSILGLFYANPSGYFGPATAAAVKKFQKQRGLRATGTVGPATRKALNAL